MDFKPTNILVFVVLLGGAGHLMIFQNGYWNDLMWLSAILCVCIPVVLYRYMKSHKKPKSRRSEKYAEI